MLLECPSPRRMPGPNVAAEALDPGLRRDDEITAEIDALAADRDARLDARSQKLLAMWPQMQQAYAGDEYVVRIRDREIRTRLTSTSLSGSKIRKVVLPRYEDHGELLKWLLLENVPGSFPYTGGVFAFKRETRTRRGCSPARATRSAPTAASSCCPRACRRSGCRPPSTA